MESNYPPVAGVPGQDAAIARVSESLHPKQQAAPGQAQSQSYQGQHGLLSSPQQQRQPYLSQSSHGDNGQVSPTDSVDASGAAAAAAVAAAHHGLQALQAATALPNPSPTPATQHYGAPYAMPPDGGMQTVEQKSQAQKDKATRLRRACDLCSVRKVKVSVPLFQHQCTLP
jgi:hypothetical protein